MLPTSQVDYQTPRLQCSAFVGQLRLKIRFFFYRDSLVTFKRDKLNVTELQTGSQINET